MRGTNRTPRLLVASLAAALLGGVAVAPPAVAAPVEVGLTYRCALPGGQDIAVRARVTVGLPDDVPWKPNSVPFGTDTFIDVDLVLGGDQRALGAGGLRLDGDSTAKLDARITGPSGDRTTTADLTFAPTRIGSGVPELRAAGGFPALRLNREGGHEVRLGGLELVLRPELPDGTPRGRVESTCVPEPGQDTLVGSLSVDGIILERPFRPTELRITATSPTTATLAWHAVPWWFETAGYEVFVDGQQVAYVPDKQVELTGLAAESQHRVKVVTRDVHGYRSPPSRGLVFTTASR
ncbi:fibronectin type III domain-containing protein [Saccharothrix obliqua]|uniref:fibronectin type III domain-containing protein n=1 Tax=Saccharothrix obliqua TaxID=2861747 RepID=UPI001C5FE5CF|nr:fibronectin type III domain-containing protein [Saccharothrix obliqua]MBW4717716.1 fibronectin type III domain-containing protein [Saccharothrix obliqua]